MPARILIADDNEVARRLLKELVREHADWEICAEAENGQVAVEKAREVKPDIVLMDLAMPVMDGLSAAREIRKSLPNAPILLITLHYFEHLEVQAKTHGIQLVVQKSDAGTQLTAAIDECLKNVSQAKTANPTTLVASN